MVGFTAVLLSMGSPVWAVMRALSIGELTKSSDAVVEGDVVHVTSFWTTDGKAIMSRATVTIVDVVRGAADQKILTVEFEGGEVGDVGMGVSDMATVSSGQRILVFLRKKRGLPNERTYEIIGRAQGLYKVGADRVARKGGFSLVPGSGEVVDNNLDVDLLKEKIRGAR